MEQEELHWLQKSRELWLQAGDRNTLFFDLSTLIRRRRNKVLNLLNDVGVWIDDPRELENLEQECKFAVTTDLGMYLGIPVLHKTIDKETFKPLLERIKGKLTGWRSRILSMASRIMLAKSVLTSIPIYSMATITLLESFCSAANIVCKPKAIGGLGIKSMRDMNLALVAKLSWRFLTNCDVIQKKYIKPSLAETSSPSPIWRSIQRGVKEVIVSGTSWVLGNGTSVCFWADVWIGDESLERMSLSHISDEEREARVCDFWDHGTG
ncbi:hypothetical protein V2J09_014618 [Rumex salicifolius]